MIERILSFASNFNTVWILYIYIYESRPVQYDGYFNIVAPFNSKLNTQIFVNFFISSLTRKTSWNDWRGLRLEST